LRSEDIHVKGRVTGIVLLSSVPASNDDDDDDDDDENMSLVWPTWGCRRSLSGVSS
jgi:hypothetical protein